MTQPQPRSDVEALTRAAMELIGQVDELNRESGTTIVDLAQRTRSNRRLIWLVLAGLALDVVLTVAMAIGGVGIAHNSRRLDTVTARLDDAQATQRAKALCPLYKLFIDSERFTPPNQTPEQAKARVDAFKIIHQGYDALDCKKITG
jgi:hypothetical protein